MTQDEREMLREIYAALFDVPAGSPKDEKPLIEGVRIMWRGYQRGTWAFRIIVWGLPTLAALGGAVQYFAGIWGKG